MLPRKRGPKGGYKLREEVLLTLTQARAEDPEIETASLLDLARERFGVEVHPRTLERALALRKKTAVIGIPSTAGCSSARAVQAYERLRSEVLGDVSGTGRELAMTMRSGMTLWARAWSGCCEPPPNTTREVARPVVQRDLMVGLVADLVVAAARGEETA